MAATKRPAKKVSKVAKKTVATQGKKAGRLDQPLQVSALPVTQGPNRLFLFRARASQLFHSLSINRRVEDKVEGYQRTLSISRVESITRYILQGKAIPGSIIVSFDRATFDEAKGLLNIPAGTDVGWVIDGQHRLAGAEGAANLGTDIELPVLAFVGLSDAMQVEMFVTINREAKNVPTSLYLDLLRVLPNKNPADVAKERAADIASSLKTDELSPFFNRIVVLTSPRAGQISLVNFTRKVATLVTPDRGILAPYTEKEQKAVIANYYSGLRQVFAKEFDAQNSIFFKTVGFGALWNAFPTFFSLTLREHQGFEVKDVAAIFRRIESFNFDSWGEYGSGSAAEISAGNDLKTSLMLAFQSPGGSAAGSLRV